MNDENVLTLPVDSGFKVSHRGKEKFLFEVFREEMEKKYSVAPRHVASFELRNASSLVKSYDFENCVNMIRFVVDTWEVLKAKPQYRNKLSEFPTFSEICASWNYQTWMIEAAQWKKESSQKFTKKTTMSSPSTPF